MGTVTVDNGTATGGGGGAPQPGAGAEEVGIKGAIAEVGGDYIVVSGSTIYYTDKTLLIFEDDTGGRFAVGQQVDVAGLQKPDGVVIATEIQVKP